MAKKDGSKKGQGLIKTALRQAVGSIFKTAQSGLVSVKQTPHVAKVEMPLQTQKDGRRFAIDLLRNIETLSKKASDYDGVFSAFKSEWMDDKLFEYPPQTQIIREAFDRIYAATEEARRGFFVVMTDRIGTISIGEMDVKAYALREKKGEMRELPNSSAEAPASGTLEQAHQRVKAAEFGELTAYEFASRLSDGDSELMDADRCLSDSQEILKGEKGSDAFNAFAAELYRLMTADSREPGGSKPRPFSVEALLSHEQPSTLTDSQTSSEAEGGEIYAQMVVDYLRNQDEYPEDVIGTIGGMRVIVLGKYGQACLNAFVKDLRDTMVREGVNDGRVLPHPPFDSASADQAQRRYNEFMAEQKPVIEKTEAQAIEDFITKSGLVRRTATAFLARRFRDTAKEISGSRDTAEAFASIVYGLEESAKNYERIVQLMEDALERMIFALYQRDDGADILKQARENR